jgi:hypothetical protein
MITLFRTYKQVDNQTPVFEFLIWEGNPRRKATFHRKEKRPKEN